MPEREDPSDTQGDTPDDLSARISELAATLFAAGDVQAVLQRVATLAVQSLEGCDSAGVFVMAEGQVTVPAAAGSPGRELDTLQLQLGQGPGLDAVASGRAVYASDLAEASPWESWGPAAVAAGVRAALAKPMSVDGLKGSLNCYSPYPEAFGIADRGGAQLLAALAGLALATAEERQEAETKADNLEAALATREMIGQAQGILMERERVSANQAFDILRRASQHLNVRLRDVAQRLVETGEDPEPPPPRAL